MSLLALTSATLGYPGQEVLRGVEVRFEAGEFVSVVGGNGSGKTTLLRSLLGVLPLRSGRLERARKLALGSCPQQLALDPLFPLSASEVVEMGLWRGSHLFAPVRRDARLRARRALEQVGMVEHRGRLFRELSGGQRQRVLVARALASEPGLLLLDEPMAGVDSGARRAIAEVLVEVQRRGTTVVVVTHDEGALAAHTTRTLQVRDGRVSLLEDPS